MTLWNIFGYIGGVCDLNVVSTQDDTSKLVYWRITPFFLVAHVRRVCVEEEPLTVSRNEVFSGEGVEGVG